MLKRVLKEVARWVALVLVSPWLLIYSLQARLISPDRALQNVTQGIAVLPGLSGQYLRNAFLRNVLAKCDATAVIEFGSTFSQVDAEIAEQVYIGPNCIIGWARIGADTLIGSAVQIPSGPNTHGIEAFDRPIREQPGKPQPVSIGENCWIGAGAIVMADVGRDTVVAAGAVVTKPLPAGVIAGGVPAKVIRPRDGSGVSSSTETDSQPKDLR